MPGVTNLFSSVDITKLDFIPDNPLQVPAFGLSTFGCSVSGGRKWRNPIIPEKDYLVPEEIPRIFLDSFGQFSETVQIHSEQQYSMVSIDFGGEISVDTNVAGEYTLGGAMKVEKERLQYKDKTTIEVSD